MVDGYARDTALQSQKEPAAIIALDLPSRTATAMLRSRYTVSVNCNYAVGETIVVPAIGEQWYVERFDLEWRLAGRVPFNDDTLNIEPEEGQVSVGSSSGPLELNGTEVRFNTMFKLGITYFRTGTDNKLQYSLDKESWANVSGAGGGGGGIDSTDDLPEGSTNKYFTNTRAAAAAPVQSVAGKTGVVTLAKADVGLNNVNNTADNDKPISSAAATALAGKADLVGGVVPDAQLPVPPVVEYDELADFPAPGAAGVLYIAADTGNLYRWDSVAENFVLIVSATGGGAASTDELPEGSTNLYFTEARAADAAPVQDDDARLTDTRTPTDNTVTTAKIVNGNVTLAKLHTDVQAAIVASPWDVSYPQTLGLRGVGYGQNALGVKLPRAVTFTAVTYRCGTADGSGTLSVELRKNGSTVTGTDANIIAANQVAGITVTGSWSFAAGDVLTVYVSTVGTSPGSGLVADIKGNS